MRSKMPLLIVLAALGVIGLIVYLGVRSYVRQFTAALPTVIKTELQSRLGRDVRFDSFTMPSSGTAVITNLRVADRKPFGQEAFFFCPRVVIRFKVYDVLMGRVSHVQSLSSVTLVHPRLRLIRNAEGEFNAQDLLLRPPVPPPMRFRGLVTIDSGTVVSVDHAARIEKLPAVNSLTGLSGALDFRPEHVFLVSLTGQGDEHRFGEMKAVGRWGIDRPITKLTLDLRRANAPYWSNYFSNVRSWEITEGSIDLHTVVSATRDGRIVARGTAKLRGASITSSRLNMSLKPFGLDVSFVETNISISGRGLLGKSPVEIRGGVSGLSPARLDLTVSSERMDFGALQSAIPSRRAIPIRWPSPGRLAARITGTGEDPLVTMSASAPRALINGIRADSISAEAVYARGSIRVTSLSAQVARGRLATTATIGLKPLGVRASGRLTGVDLAALYAHGTRPSGIADLTFEGAYARGSPSGRVSAAIRDGSFGGYSFREGAARVSMSGMSRADVAFSIGPGDFEHDVKVDSASGDISIRGRRIIVRRLAVNGAGGAISATGDMTEDGELNFRVAMKHINLETLLGPMGQKDVIGNMDFDGAISGTIGNPRLIGTIEILNGRFRDLPLDTASVRLTASTAEVGLEDPVIRSGASEIVGTGRVSIVAGTALKFDMRVRVSRLSLATLDSLFATKLNAKGTADADLLVRGEYPDLRVSGEVLAENAVISGAVIDRVRLVAQTVGAETLIEEMVLQQGNARVIGRGRIGPQGRLQADFAGENLNLNLLNGALGPYVVLEGPANLTGQVTGSLSRPLIQAKLAAGSFTANKRTFDSVTSSLSWDGESLSLGDCSLVSGPSKYALSSARFIAAKRSIQLEAAVTSGDVSAILELLRNSPVTGKPEGEPLRRFLESVPMPAKGVFDGSLDLAASLADEKSPPELKASLAAREVLLADMVVGEINADVRYEKAAIYVDRMDINGPSGQASISGAIGADGVISITGEGKALSLAVLKPFLPGEPVSGILDFTASASGTMSDAQVKGSLRVTDIKIGKVCVAVVSADQLVIAGGRITSERVLIQEKDSTMTLSGYVPFAFGLPFVPRDQPMMVRAEVADQDLSITRCFTNAITEASGPFRAIVIATGTLDKPVLNGDISLRNGSLSLKGFRNAFTDITLAASIRDSQLILDTLNGTSSMGGTFSGTGNVTVAGGQRTISASLNLNALRLSTATLTETIGERMEFTATGVLTASESLKSPLVNGQLVVSNARITLPAKEISIAVTIPPLPISPRLAVTVNLARDVVVERGGLRAEIVGPITIGGALPNPIIVGTVQIVKGGLSFPGRTLQFLPGAVATLVLRPPDPAVISVSLTAVTSVTTVSAFIGHIVRYRVFFDVSGLLGDLSINVRSSPPGLGGVDALAAVFGGSALEAVMRGEPAEQVFQEQLGQVLLGFAFPGLFQPISVGGLTFSLTPGLLVPLELSATMFISDKVTLTYAQSLFGSIIYDSVSLSYMLSPRFAVTGEFDFFYWVPQEMTLLVEYYKTF